MPQDPLEAVVVDVQHPIEDPLGRSEKTAWLPVVPDRFQEAAAEHRRERDGNNAGNQDRRGNRDSEFAE